MIADLSLSNTSTPHPRRPSPHQRRCNAWFSRCVLRAGGLELAIVPEFKKGSTAVSSVVIASDHCATVRHSFRGTSGLPPSHSSALQHFSRLEVAQFFRLAKHSCCDPLFLLGEVEPKRGRGLRSILLRPFVRHASQPRLPRFRLTVSDTSSQVPLHLTSPCQLIFGIRWVHTKLIALELQTRSVPPPTQIHF
ncbi:hypothetical protein LF1_50160 [Rubripirellula obstinata]|uniref:Uncharacterized protein n=1 Tax=Rubripirellula obstinata TaxID=406547 RepID=A0A5B1CPY6_9BACT|nr:hypothetical protein LF1_50160 [Rubripirellula obstinata]